MLGWHEQAESCDCQVIALRCWRNVCNPDRRENSDVGTQHLTLVGAVFATVTLLLMVFRPRWLPALLAASVPFPHTAAVVFLGNGISPFYLLAVVSAIRGAYLIVRRCLDGRSMPRTWFRHTPIIFIVFGAYSVAISFVGPAVFQGMSVFSPRGGIDQQVGHMTALTFTISNIAQPVYLLLGISVVFYLGLEERVNPNVFEISVWIGALFALARLILPAYWPTAVFENMPNVNYSVTQSALRGTFGEPSMFGFFIVCGLAFSVATAVFSRGWPRTRTVSAAVLLGIELIFNRSWTAQASIGLLLIVSLVILVRHELVRRRVKRLGTTIVVLTLLAVGAAMAPVAFRLVEPKLQTMSFENRTAADARALEIFLQSWGAGIGLGSNRPSSVVALLLSCVGIVGTVAFFSILVFTVTGSIRVRATSPVGWALLGAAIAEAISVPELSMPALWMLMGLAAWSVEIRSEKKLVAAAEGQESTTRPTPMETLM